MFWICTLCSLAKRTWGQWSSSEISNVMWISWRWEDIYWRLLFVVCTGFMSLNPQTVLHIDLWPPDRSCHSVVWCFPPALLCRGLVSFVLRTNSGRMTKTSEMCRQLWRFSSPWAPRGVVQTLCAAACQTKVRVAIWWSGHITDWHNVQMTSESGYVLVVQRGSGYPDVRLNCHFGSLHIDLKVEPGRTSVETLWNKFKSNSEVNIK